MKTKWKRFWEWVRTRLTPNELFHKNEVQANKLGEIVLFNSGLFLALILLLTAFKIFPLGLDGILPPTVQGMVEIAILMVVCRIVKDDAWWLKYLLVLAMIGVYARLDAMLTHKVWILMVIPVVFSSRYFSRKLTVSTAVLTSLVFLGSSIHGAVSGLIDLNIVTMDPGVVMKTTGGFLGDTVKNAGVTSSMLIHNTLLYNYLPKWLMFSVVAVISCNMAKRGYEMVITQHEKDTQTARIESELSLANSIQANMLPSIFPAFPEHVEFDIYATMTPAKEVGGDFYDFFMLDETHLAAVIADVSGKGVPAALFMVIAKTIIKNHAQMGLPPAEIMTRTNKLLCEGNEAGLFVTAWFCVLDTEKHTLTYVNAGHTPPLIKRKNGKYEYLHSRPGFVLAGMDTTRYRQFEIPLEPGDKLFLYTDGVTEATDAENRLYGSDRLAACLNAMPDADVYETLAGVKKDIDAFVGAAEQFDDITMLVLESKGTGTPLTERTFAATDAELPNATAFLEEQLEAVGAPMKAVMQLSVALEEIFVNVAHYAYPNGSGDVTIGFGFDSDTRAVTLRFADGGIPFDPLAAEDPDTTLSAEERRIGGLGILMVKKTADDIFYRHQDGRNILTVIKKI